MAGTDRPRRIRAFTQQLCATTGVQITTRHTAGARWTLEWLDGPCPETVQAAADAADLGGAELELRRFRSPRAYAATALRLAQAGQLPYQTRLAAQRIEDAIMEQDFPDRVDHPQQQHLVQALLTAATRAGRVDTDQVADLVARRGVAWLLDDQDLSPVQLLTARYATGDHQADWRRRAQPMPLSAAVTAALADAEADEQTVRAVLAVLPALRAEQARIEMAALAAAHRAGLGQDTRAIVTGAVRAGDAAERVTRLREALTTIADPPGRDHLPPEIVLRTLVNYAALTLIADAGDLAGVGAPTDPGSPS